MSGQRRRRKQLSCQSQCILITCTNIRKTFSNVRKKNIREQEKGRPWVSCELTELEVKLERRPRIIIIIIPKPKTGMYHVSSIQISVNITRNWWNKKLILLILNKLEVKHLNLSGLSLSFHNLRPLKSNIKFAIISSNLWKIEWKQSRKASVNIRVHDVLTKKRITDPW